jgi:hypothetical protein
MSSVSHLAQTEATDQLDVSEPPSMKWKWRVDAVPVDFHYHVMIKAGGREADEYPRYIWYCETEEQAKELADKLVDVDVGVIHYPVDGVVEK